MDIFSGITSVDWGFNAADIWKNGMFIVTSLATFIVLGIVIRFAPTIIMLVKNAATSSHRYSASDWVEEFKATDHHIRNR